MSHDPGMHAMMTSTLFLLVVPLAFVAIGILWYRLSMDGRSRRLEEEVAVYGGDEGKNR